MFLNYEPKCSVNKDFKLKEGYFKDKISSEQPGYTLDDSFDSNLHIKNITWKPLLILKESLNFLLVIMIVSLIM